MSTPLFQHATEFEQQRKHVIQQEPYPKSKHMSHKNQHQKFEHELHNHKNQDL